MAVGIQNSMSLCHIVICGLLDCIIFSHIISLTARFSKNVIEHKMCFDFSLQLLSETFLILRRTERDMIKNVYWSSCKVPYSSPILMKLEFSQLILEK